MIVCPRCGLTCKPTRFGGVPGNHYNRWNPPVLGAWKSCPGPTAADVARAARWRQSHPETAARLTNHTIRASDGRWNVARATS